MAQTLGDSSRSRCPELAGLALAPGWLEPEALGCRTPFWALQAAAAAGRDNG